ncbi:unnamed protein product [Hyaloperonospora brassicae]|uniref:K Homology domain-containing protein n=1 Tax=Hyaloperonospora brassicae TaxID=162125 RepID=A0AAV0UJ57_HYABA|nr:unnamed protein product [Hyaloperonospora brassicae]
MSTPSDAALLRQTQQQLETAAAAKSANAAAGKLLDEKLRVALKNVPRRPHGSLERLKEEMDTKEWHRNTTSMSAADERVVLRELQQLQDKVAQHTAFDSFQAQIDALRVARQERFEQHKTLTAELHELQQQQRQLQLAAHLHMSVADFVTIQVPIPEDRMGSIIGKQFARVHQLEKECSAMLEVDSKQNMVTITSALEQVETAKKAIEDITLATSHAIGLHPDTVKVLMSQRAKLLRELEKSHKVKIDVSKADGILTVVVSPDKVKLLKKAIDGLTAGKVDILLPSEIVPKLIGKKGEAINKLMQDTGALVDIDKVTNNVRLVGTKEGVAGAETYIQELISKESQREKNYTPENSDMFKGSESAPHKFEFFAEFLMANKAKQLRLLRAKAFEARVKVLKKERQIQVAGNSKQLDAMEDAIRERFKYFELHHWMCEVADNHLLSLIIGKKGSKIKEIEREGKESSVRIDIQDTFVCVFGDDAEAINSARAKIMEIVESNQRSVFLTSRGLISVLMASKREKLTNLEHSSGCKLHLPPLARDAAARSSASESNQVKISLTGTLDAIRKAKKELEQLNEAHHVRYLPLDNDEVPIVIGKNGETVADLETKSGSKVRVLRGTSGQSSELEMTGTQEQLNIGDRIKAMRLAHPEATLDAFPNRGQVRVKASTSEALQTCVDDVLKTLQETHVVESVHVSQQEQQTARGLPPGSAVPVLPNFGTLLEKNESIAIRLRELEAEGGEGMRVSIENEGKVAKIRGPAIGIGKIRNFLEMLVSPDSHFVETIPLPLIAFASALEVKGSAGKLNENALQICTQTGCELHITRSSAAGPSEEGAIRIEGTNASNVYKAKAEVEKLLQFYYTDCFQTLDDLPSFIATRIYELLPFLRVKYNVVFSLPTKTSLKVFTDSKVHAQEIREQLEKDVEAWKKQLVELPIATWLVPILVGRNGETIKKIGTDSNARLDLNAPPPSGSRCKGRVLTISARDSAAAKTALEKVKEILIHHENLSSVVNVGKAKLDVALSVKKEAAKGVQFHVIDGKEEGDLQVVIYSDDHNERERIVEMMEHLLDQYVVVTITLPTSVSPSSASSMIGSLIGKSGANIRALQKQFTNVTIDIRRDKNSVTLKGPTDEVQKVRTIMDDKIQELLRNEHEFQLRRNGRCQKESENQEEDEKDTGIAHDSKASDDPTQSQSLPQQPQLAKNVGPVAGTPGTGDTKLTKNQRRRMRKRAENEKQNALSAVLGTCDAAAAV